jgi:hypothetical protein
VVDADSDDGTIEAIEAARDRMGVPVRLDVADERLPIGEARNRAVGLAGAPNVAFVSADVELHEDWARQALASLEDADMVFSRQVHAPRSWSVGAAARGLRYHFPDEPTDDPLRYASNAAAAYRREVLETFPVDPAVVAVDDLLLADRAARAGHEATYNPAMVAYHHDVADLAGETSKCVREARGWGLNVHELGPMTPVLAWGLALLAVLAVLAGGLLGLGLATVLAVVVLWAPAVRRVPRALGQMPPTALAGGVLVGPFLDLVFLFNYARGLWEALVSRPSADPEGMQR